MPERPHSDPPARSARTRALSFMAFAATAGLMSGFHLPRKDSVTTLVVFVLFVAVGELLEVNLPWGGLVTMGLAPAVGFMLPLACPTETSAARTCYAAGNGPAEVAAVFAGGALIALAVRRLRRRDTRIESLALQAVAVVLASTVYVWLARLDKFDAFGPANISYFGIVGVFVVTIAADAVIPSLATAVTEHLPLLPQLRGRLRSSAALQMASVSVGALLALAHPALGNWSFPLFLVPLVATQYSFRQYAFIRKTYLQTIGALAKVPEMAGYTEPGHSSRVAQLAVEVAQEMGAEQAKIEEIQYAALLHDIGRLSLPDPETADEGTHRLQLAIVGAEIVEQTGYLPGVAGLIRNQYEPYRRRGEDQNPQLDLGAKIIKVASAYDDLTHPGGVGRTPWDALERIHLNLAYEYDPAVVQALTRVLEKRSKI